MQILEEAYAVVLAGGTLQPIEETRVRLFPNLSINELQFFTCKHIVPPESILSTVSVIELNNIIYCWCLLLVLLSLFY